MWSHLTGRVSHHALKLILVQLELAKPFVEDHATPIPSYTGAFLSMMGLPCMYRMATLVKEEGAINQTELNMQWWLKKPYLTPLGDMASEYSDFKSILATLEEFHDSLDPLDQQILKKRVIEQLDRPPPTSRGSDTTRPRGRPSSDTSSRSEPNAFGHAEPSGKRKCSQREQIGHNKRTCTQTSTTRAFMAASIVALTNTQDEL